MAYKEYEEPPTTISEVIIGLMTGTIAIGILSVLYLMMKLIKLVFS
jgi:hypothetical protein